MIITKAQKDDVQDIMVIVDEAKTYLKSQNVNQWQDGYPNKESFYGDIKNDCLYVVKDENKVIGVFALVTYEPTYNTIYEGKWLSDKEYVAVHRIAIEDKYKGKGVAKFIFDELKKKYKHLRVDTHRHNRNMNRCLIKNGFEYCGIIYLARNSESDTERFAYEYLEA